MPEVIDGDVVGEETEPGGGPPIASVSGANVSVPTYSGDGTESASSQTVSGVHVGVHSVGIDVKGDGGTVSAATSTTIDIAAGGCYMRPTDDKTNTLEYLSWDAVTGYGIGATFDEADEVYIYLDYAGGATIKYSETNPDSTWRVQDVILLAEVHMDGAGIINSVHDVRQFVGNHIQEFSILHRDVFGVLVSGQEVSEVATRKIQINSGIFHNPGYNNISVAAFDSSASDTFSYWYYNGSSWVETTSQTQLDTNQYNDITSGLVTIEGTKWKKDWIYRLQDGAVHVVYGNDFYHNETDAMAAVEPTLPVSLQESEHSYKMSTWHKVKENTSGALLDRARRQPSESGEAKFAPIAPRNYSTFEYFTLINMFHIMAEANAETLSLGEDLRNAYIDIFGTQDYIESLHGLVLTGTSCILDLNPLYAGESATIQGYETLGQLRQCHFGDCSSVTWKDTDIQVDPTTYEGGLGITAKTGTYIGRIARGADPGNQTNFWTCLLQNVTSGITSSTVSINVNINIPTGTWPAGVSCPIVVHLRGDVGGEEWYSSSQFITADTGGSWVQYSFNVENCPYLGAADEITEIGITIGKGLANTQDIVVYIDDMTYSFGTIKSNHGIFKRHPIETAFDISETFTDRRTVVPVEIGYVTNHISLDGTHYKRDITLANFISAETGGELEDPDSEYKEDITLTQDAITFRYNMPSGDDSVHDLHVYKGTDNTIVLSRSDILFSDNFDSDTLSNYTETKDGSGNVATHETDHIQIINSGNSITTHEMYDETNEFNTDQFSELKITLDDQGTPGTLTSYQTAGICLRTTNNTSKGYWAGIHHNTTNARFVIGKDEAIVATGTYALDDATDGGTQFCIHFTAIDNGSNVDLSARFFDSTCATLHEGLTYQDTSDVIASGSIGWFGGSVAGSSAAVVCEFDGFKEYYGYGEYIHVNGTPDYVDFIPGREPAVAIKGTYLKDYAGSWDNKRCLVILAHLEKDMTLATQADTPEIDDFLQIAKVTELDE